MSKEWMVRCKHGNDVGGVIRCGFCDTEEKNRADSDWCAEAAVGISCAFIGRADVDGSLMARIPAKAYEMALQIQKIKNMHVEQGAAEVAAWCVRVSKGEVPVA